MLTAKYGENAVSEANTVASFDHRRSLTLSTNSEIEQVQGVEWHGFIFLPFNFYWRCVVGITTVFMVFVSIYDLTYENVNPPISYHYARYICNIIYLCDTVLYTLHRHLTSIQVTRVYLPKSSFLLLIDYLTLIPMDLFYKLIVINKTGHSPNVPNALRMINVLRAYRLIVFFTDESNILNTDLYEAWVIIGSHMLLQFLICHLFAALWYYIGRNQEDYKTWAINLKTKDFDSENKFSWFLWSFFFVTGVFSHDLIFDIRAENFNERLIVMVILFIGFSLTFAVLYGNLIVTYIESNRRHFSFSEKMGLIKQYMERWDVSQDLEKRTYDYYEAFWKRRSAVKDASFFNKLPLALQKEVNLDIFWEALVHSHLFSKMDMSFKRSICLNMKSEFLLPGEYLYKFGALKTKMVYVVTGVVQILSDEDFESPVASFSSGTLLGETSILLPTRSTANVICATYCEVHTLSIKGLFDALKNYPKKTKQLRAVLAERIRFANTTIARAKFYSKHSSKLESMEMDKNSLHNETKWLKERYRRAYMKEMEADMMSFDDLNYWKREADKMPEEIIQHTSQYVDLYAFSDEVELKTDIICLKATFPWILEPDSSFLKIWDAIMQVVIFMVCMTVPYYVAFIRTIEGVCYILTTIYQVFYFIDICIQCTTAIKTKDLIITDFWAIIRYRLKQVTFLVDILSVLPLATFMKLMAQLPETVALRGVINLMFRVYKLVRFIHKREASLWANILIVRIIKYLLLYLIAVYWMAALLYVIACPGKECIELSWYSVGKKIDLATNSKLVDFQNDFVISFFFSFSLITSIGINKVYAQNSREVMVCLFSIMLNIVLRSVTYSELTATLIMKSKQRVKYQALIAEMKRFGNENKLTSDLQYRIENFLIFQWSHSKGSYMMLEEDLLLEASTELRESIVDMKIRELLEEIPLFQDADPDFLNVAVKVAKCHALPPNAHVTVVGVRTTTLVIVRKGYCRVRSQLVGDVADDREVIAGPGSHFPLVEFLHRIPVFVQVTTLTHCEVVSFDYHTLLNTMKLYSHIYKAVQEVLTLPDMDLSHVKYVSQDRSKGHYFAGHEREDIANLYPEAGDGFGKLPPEKEQYLPPFQRLGKFHVVRYLLLTSAIQPESRFLKCWEIGRALLAICTLIVSPMIYCGLAPYREARYVGYMLDATAYADILLRFNVGYYTDKGLLVSHPLYTAHHYFTHAFFIDLLGSFPFVLVQVHMLFGRDVDTKYLLLHAALIMTRGLQVYRFLGLCRYLESDIRRINDYIATFRLLMLLLFFWHYLANIVVFWGAKYNFDVNGFVGIKIWEHSGLVNTNLYKLGPKDTLKLYLIAMYLSACIFTSNMVGVFLFSGTDIMILFLVVGFCSFFYQLIFFASISSMDVVGNISLTKYQERMNDLVSFLRKEETDERLLKNAINNFEHDWSITRGTNVYKVLSKFHSALQEDVTYKLYGDALKGIDIFVGADEVFYRIISKYVKVVHQKRGSIIIKFNQFDEAIYIINKGKVEVKGSSTKLRGVTLQQGCLFGNLDIFKSPARYTAIAHHTVELLVIPNTLLYSIMDDHEIIRRKFMTALGENRVYIGKVKTVDSEDQQSQGELPSGRVNYPFLSVCSLWTKDMLIYKICFTFLNLFLSYISVISILYHIGFKSQAAFISAFIYTMDILFMLRIYIGFRTAYEDKTTGVLVTDSREIAKRYIRSWFFIDLVSLLPLEIMSYAINIPASREEASYWLKINRTLRILFLIQFFNTHLKRVNVSNYMRLVQAFVWASLAIEAMACVHLMISCYNEHCYYKESYFGEKMVETTSNTEQGLVAQMYVLNIFIGTGLRDVLPLQLAEISFAILCAIICQFLAAFTISCIASFNEVTCLSKYNYRHEAIKLKDFLKDRDLSPYLLSKTTTYALQLWLRAKGEWLPVLLKEAPTYLREDLMMALYGKHLRHNMLFTGTHEDFLSQLTAKLDRCVFFPGDYIVEKGDVDGNMFFIHDGEVEVVHRNKYFVETVIECIKTNQVFGIAQGLYKNKAHFHIYRAKTVVDLLILNRNKCQETLKIFPAASSDIYGKAQGINFTL